MNIFSLSISLFSNFELQTFSSCDIFCFIINTIALTLKVTLYCEHVDTAITIIFKHEPGCFISLCSMLIVVPSPYNVACSAVMSVSDLGPKSNFI